MRPLSLAPISQKEFSLPPWLPGTGDEWYGTSSLLFPIVYQISYFFSLVSVSFSYNPTASFAYIRSVCTTYGYLSIYLPIYLPIYPSVKIIFSSLFPSLPFLHLPLIQIPPCERTLHALSPFPLEGKKTAICIRLPTYAYRTHPLYRGRSPASGDISFVASYSVRPVLHRLDETVRLENIGLCNAFVTQYFLLLFASRDSEDADAMRCYAMLCSAFIA